MSIESFTEGHLCEEERGDPHLFRPEFTGPCMKMSGPLPRAWGGSGFHAQQLPCTLRSGRLVMKKIPRPLAVFRVVNGGGTGLWGRRGWEKDFG